MCGFIRGRSTKAGKAKKFSYSGGSGKWAKGTGFGGQAGKKDAGKFPCQAAPQDSSLHKAGMSDFSSLHLLWDSSEDVKDLHSTRVSPEK
jgi:hypothetical protein